MHITGIMFGHLRRRIADIRAVMCGLGVTELRGFSFATQRSMCCVSWTVSHNGVRRISRPNACRLSGDIPFRQITLLRLRRQICMSRRSPGKQATRERTHAASVGRLATTIHLLLREHRLALPPDQQLLDELANVRLKESFPGVYRMDHDPDKHDDQAIALSLAANHLITRPPKRNWAAY